MQEEEKIFSNLKELVSKSELSLSKENNIDLKINLVSFISIFNEIILLFNRDIIIDLKNNRKSLFLNYLVNLRYLLDNLIKYFHSFDDEIKTFYTEDISDEIKLLISRIEKLNKNLEYDKIYFELEEKNKLEKEFNELNQIILERDSLKKKYITLKNYDVNELKKEIKELTLTVTKEQETIDKLLFEKNSKEDKLNLINILRDSINNIDNKIKKEEDKLLVEINKYLKSKDNFINEKENANKELKDKLIKESNKLIELENSIKNQIKDISIKKENYIKIKSTLNRHIESGESFINYYSDFTKNIENKISKIQKDIFELENDIKDLIISEQKIIDELNNTPYKIESLD